VGAFLTQQAHQVHQPQRGRVAVGAGSGGIDDKDAFPALVHHCRIEDGRVRRVPLRQ